jgi:hypothetical protein
MKKIFKYTLFAVSVLLCSCDAIYDDGGDCSVKYEVRFVDDMNLQRADAFDQDITSVSLYVFDENNTLVMRRVESGASLRSSASVKNAIDISSLEPGKYHLVAWAQLEDNASFSVTTLTRDVSHLEDMTCRLKRTRSDDGLDIVDSELDPIYHGMTDITIHENEDPGTYQFDIQLTKDVKSITVLLQQLDGSKMDPDRFKFVVEANNGLLNHDNSLLSDESFKYVPYNQLPVNTELSTVGNTRSDEVSAVLAYISTARLVNGDWTKYTRPTLSVTDSETGKTVLSIPLIDYALLVRSNYNSSMETQEYLDRMDEISMTFFLNGDKWVNNVVIINSWKVVINEDDFE